MLTTKMKFVFFLTVFLVASSCGGEESPRSEHKSKKTGSSAGTSSDLEVTPENLRVASLNGDMDIVRRALEQGLDLHDADPLGRTAVMFASYNGHTDIVRLLVKQGADVSEKNSEGRTPLMFAASGPFPETVELLLREGADPNAIDSVEGWSALMYAAAEGNLKVVNVLLKYNADVSLKDDDGEAAVDFAKNNGHEEVVISLEK